jgi:hypothetical protein
MRLDAPPVSKTPMPLHVLDVAANGRTSLQLEPALEAIRVVGQPRDGLFDLLRKGEVDVPQTTEVSR